ncbi:MAG: hypothetical protein K6A32_05690 [Bacteroidales bacterium]|nr:hypothetical protein [Bacteroidales bacterium]
MDRSGIRKVSAMNSEGTEVANALEYEVGEERGSVESMNFSLLSHLGVWRLWLPEATFIFI